MAESRLQRWSRRKTESAKVPEPVSVPVAEPKTPPEQRELEVNEALPEQELLAKYDLPDPDAIELGTDITGFMKKEIPEFLRRRALRSLWKSNPVLAVLDGLNDYDEDYTDAANAGKLVKTLYKVGQGFDRTAPTDTPTDERDTAASAKGADPVMDVSQTEATPEQNTGEPEPSGAVETTTDTEAAPEPAPRYRPRMRFT